MLRLLILFSAFSIFVSSAQAADTPFDKLLKASKVLAVNSSDSESLEVLKGNLELFSETSVKSSIVKVIGLSLLNSDKSKFEAFQSEVKSKYPWMDFSFVDDNAGDYGSALTKSVNYLALNASSAFEEQSGVSVAKLMVKPRMDATEVFGAPETKEVAKLDEEKPEKMKEETPEDNKDELAEKMKEAGKTKAGDIAEDSIYFKIYHAAVNAQKGDGNGIRELVKLTFEEKPEELTSAVVKAMTLGMLSANSKSTNPYIIKVNSVYLDNAFLNFLDEEPFTVDCRLCLGKGQRESKCKKCLNGTCRNCKGAGEIRYKGLGGEVVQKACPTCEGKKKCKSCNGDRIEKKDCYSCGARGSKFNTSVFKTQFNESLQYVIDLTPKLADEANVYIGVGVNKLAVARIEKIRQAQREKEAAEKARMLAEREKELARLEEERKKPKVKEIKQNGQTVIVTEFEVTEGESNENLDYAVFEFENYLKAQQKRTKSSIYEKVYGKFEGAKSMLYIEISDAFQQNGAEYKEQVLDGFYRFWKLRSGANGAGGNVDVKMLYQGKVVAGTKDGSVFVN
ncbi:MAG: hypothetical protein NE327_18450 [Lentisphaeraceae bacterium]|nr:hypothetical protein [Lentisphaeraceae bacterium]